MVLSRAGMKLKDLRETELPTERGPCINLNRAPYSKHEVE